MSLPQGFRVTSTEINWRARGNTCIEYTLVKTDNVGHILFA